MRVLVACEFSGTVRDAFSRYGHESYSCDLLPTEKPGNHIVGDVREVMKRGWDLIIAHPPCTHLCVSGARWFNNKHEEQVDAIEFFLQFALIDCPKVCIENPIGIMSTIWHKPDQIIQPWWFGHGETKATCLWLRGLKKLVPTCVVPERVQRVGRLPPSKDRWKIRSRTYQGVADAMAQQWGGTP